MTIEGITFCGLKVSQHQWAETATIVETTSSNRQTSIKVATLVKKDYTVLKRVCPSMSFKETTNNNLIETSKTE